MFNKFLSVFFVLGVSAAARLCAFDIKPIVIPVDREVTITIRATGEAEKRLLEKGEGVERREHAEGLSQADHD